LPQFDETELGGDEKTVEEDEQYRNYNQNETINHIGNPTSPHPSMQRFGRPFCQIAWSLASLIGSSSLRAKSFISELLDTETRRARTGSGKTGGKTGTDNDYFHRSASIAVDELDSLAGVAISGGTSASRRRIEQALADRAPYCLLPPHGGRGGRAREVGRCLPLTRDRPRRPRRLRRHARRGCSIPRDWAFRSRRSIIAARFRKIGADDQQLQYTIFPIGNVSIDSSSIPVLNIPDRSLISPQICHTKFPNSRRSTPPNHSGQWFARAAKQWV
jgi:hypothetical protein